MSEPDFGKTLRRLAIAGTAAIALFAGTVGVWAVATNLSGAVIASGQFVIDGNVKKVQHHTGGIVGELRIRDGDRVEQDAVLIRLDDTLTRSNLQIVATQLDEFAARRARLLAERDGKPSIDPAPTLLARRDEPAITSLLAAEQGLFEARRSARDGQKAQLAKRIGQLRDEITGLTAQQAARDRQAVLIEDELKGVRELYAKSLVSLTRKTALEREGASLEGQRGQLIASVAQAEGRIAETQLQIIQIDETLREEVMKELREIESKMAELSERRVAAEDQLKRMDIRAPSAGYVHQLSVHTVGGVVTAAEPIMLVVPSQDALTFEARVNPSDIDQIAPGRQALIRVHAFNQRTTPELFGTVNHISADTSRDPQTGAFFYTIRVGITADERARLLPNRITPGMLADAFVRTQDRTPLQFLLAPLTDQIARAFRER